MRAERIEVWRTVDGWPYEVSSLGRVRRAARRWYLNSRPDGILRGSPGRGGYLRVTLSDIERKTTRPVHQLVCEAFHGPRPSAAHVAAHRNGINVDNSASNLRWATRQENEADKRFHGTAVVGSIHPLAKLREVDVVAIRALLATGRASHGQIAAIFGVSVGKIAQIATGRSWKHVA